MEPEYKTALTELTKGLTSAAIATGVVTMADIYGNPK
jgi:hypothetical protein